MCMLMLRFRSWPQQVGPHIQNEPRPFDAEFQKDPEWRVYLSDGLHLTARGNGALYTLLQRLIDTQLPHLASVSRLKSHLIYRASC